MQASTRHAVEAGDEFGNSHFGRDIHAQTDVIVIAIHPRQTMPQNRGTRSPRCRAYRLRTALVKTLPRYCVTKAEQTCRTDSKISAASMIAASGDRSSLSTFDLATQGHRLYSTSQQAAQVAEIAATCRFVVQSCAKPRTRRVAGGMFLQADISAVSLQSEQLRLTGRWQFRFMPCSVARSRSCPGDCLSEARAVPLNGSSPSTPDCVSAIFSGSERTERSSAMLNCQSAGLAHGARTGVA